MKYLPETPLTFLYRKYKNKNNIEYFENNNRNGFRKILGIFLTLFALYLSFKCKNGFDLANFLMACCCPPCYVVYQLALNYKQCFPPKNISPI